MLTLAYRCYLKAAVLLVIACFIVSEAMGQRSDNEVLVITSDDYERAEGFLNYNTEQLALRSSVLPQWLDDDRFWYRVLTERGNEFILVHPRQRAQILAFDHVELARALSEASGKLYEAFKLPFSTFEFFQDGKEIKFRVDGVDWSCNLEITQCSEDEFATHDSTNDVVSPNGKLAVFIQDWNLWLRDRETGKTTQLTTDGIKNYGYATDNAGWRKSDRPIVVWSPDSEKIFTFQQDQRRTGEMYLVNTTVGHPTLESWKYPLPGDAEVTMIERVIIHVKDSRVMRLLMDRDHHRSTLCDDLVCRGEWGDVQWSPNSSEVAFVSTSRDHRNTKFRVAGTESGEVREVFDENVNTFFESGNGALNWRYLPASREVIWFSERDNWGQLYLYDLESGLLKNAITRGEGNVTEVLFVDEKERVIYFVGVGKEVGRNPYYRHLYRVGFDGKEMQLLTPEDADHNITLSTSGRFIIDSYSTPEIPPVAILRANDGESLMTLEESDITQLLATGWKPPTPFSTKARDGVTDIYGMMFRPTNFDSKRNYPIINNIYPGPQSGSVRGWGFRAARGDAQAIAELGFVVVQINGMGTPGRSKEFHEIYYGDMGDNTLPDQVTAMKQLASRYPWIDLEQAGIYGHSGGGYATSGAMFHYPDFFKVGVSQAGNHDNRVYEDDWGEKWQGLRVTRDDGTDSYFNQANQNFANKLKGKLLLAHGTLDDNVPYYSTLLVVEALIEANKDFDLILFPNRKHGFGDEPYMMRRRWDYFVQHLLGARPPESFTFNRPAPR